MIGQTISHYKVTEKLGEGGMGVVYKAEDTKLKRSVALKFLRSDVLEDGEHKERFFREAQAAAGLNHPNICTIYEIDEANGSPFIAMELVEGETVKQKIKARPLPLDGAIDIAAQTAQGLQVAHEKGIVHRDIKSSNLIVTPQGQVKIMDFGLAQLAERSQLTKTATILGTPAYMSPEQARKSATDRRTDVWSLGVVIYEMVTGTLPFERERLEAVLYAIGNEEPEPVTALRAGLPMELEWVVGKALAKHREDRYQHVEEMIVDLRGLSKELPSGKSTVLRPQRAAAPIQAPSEDLGLRRKLRLPWVVAAVAALVALAVSFVHFREMLPEAPLRRFAITPAVDVPTGATEAGVAVSPNGKHIAYTGAGTEGKLWIQDLDQSRPRVLEGTDGAVLPFWSPDSSFVGFAAGSELKKIAVSGGIPIRLCPLPSSVFAGGSWSPDDQSIAFSSGNYEIYEVPARGGAANLLIAKEQPDSTAEGPTGFLGRPHFLPAGAGTRVLVYSFGSAVERTLMVQDLDGGRRKILGPGFNPFYSSSGHLIYQSDLGTDELWALPFSLSSLSADGGAFPITQNGSGPTVAADQTLVYLDGSRQQQQQLAWLDRSGQKIGEIGSPFDARDVALSPDEKLVAVSALEGGNRDVWIWEISRGVKSRLTFSEATDGVPIWSPTGAELVFASRREGINDIFLRKADGTGEPKPLAAGPLGDVPTDWSRDGRYLVYEVVGPDNIDIRYLERKGDGDDWESRPYLQTPYWEGCAKLSPDGRFLVYLSNESGRYEIYVRPFPEGGGRTAVSTNGGTQPRWSRDGKEIFYVEGTTLVAVEVSTSPDFSVGSVTRLFEHRVLARQSGWPVAQYDVSADGRRFVFAAPVDEESEQEVSIRVVENWYEEFRGRERD